MNHTAGDWKAHYEDAHDDPSLGKIIPVCGSQQRGGYVASVNANIERGEANAQLIATAPKMLRLLKRIANKATVNNPRGEKLSVCRLIQLAKEVIEEATADPVKSK